MSVVTLLAIAVALAMDAFAVAVATGVMLKTVSLRQTFRLSFHFGLFQALMPIIGWSAGQTVHLYIQDFDHWIAFALLLFIGGKMLWEALTHKEEEERSDPTKGLTLVMLAVATSIDALAVGLSLSLLRVPIWTPAAVIGVVALCFTVAGLHIGRIVGSRTRLSLYAEIVGGLVLVGIGLKILFDHSVVA